jgi:hypothetical protein
MCTMNAIKREAGMEAELRRMPVARRELDAGSAGV